MVEVVYFHQYSERIAGVLANNIKQSQGSTNCGILKSRLENMEKMENTKQMIQNTLFMTQNALVVDQMTRNTSFYSIYRDG